MEGNNLIKKGVVAAVILLFVSVSVIPTTGTTIETTIGEQVVYIGEGKPDLIIEDIVIKPDIFLYLDDIFLRVKNIGDTKNIEAIEYVVVVKRMLFGLIPIYVETFKARHVTVIEPGKAKDLFFHNSEYLPLLGFFKLYCTVNPDQTIDEEYFYNNNYDETFLVIFKSWKEV